MNYIQPPSLGLAQFNQFSPTWYPARVWSSPTRPPPLVFSHPAAAPVLPSPSPVLERAARDLPKPTVPGIGAAARPAPMSRARTACPRRPRRPRAASHAPGHGAVGPTALCAQVPRQDCPSPAAVTPARWPPRPAPATPPATLPCLRAPHRPRRPLPAPDAPGAVLPPATPCAATRQDPRGALHGRRAAASSSPFLFPGVSSPHLFLLGTHSSPCRSCRGSSTQRRISLSCWGQRCRRWGRPLRRARAARPLGRLVPSPPPPSRCRLPCGRAGAGGRGVGDGSRRHLPCARAGVGGRDSRRRWGRYPHRRERRLCPCYGGRRGSRGG
jgi:hypothetical protein